ncbi:MAG: DUF4978 domain-containing protein [Clostridia bacterium]|nr:DUF4978 domain-containing protein [Clostridia bacterium]
MKYFKCLLASIFLFAAACGGVESDGGKYSLPVEFTEKSYTADGAAAYEGNSPYSGLDETGKYLVSDGVPLLMLGGQLRTDFFMQLEGKTIDELDQYFKLAREMNVTMVQIPICWSDIETAKGVYSVEYVEKYIEYCEKYELKLELLWFGSWMCGVSVAGYIPQYVMNDQDTYQAINRNMYNGWLGKTWMLMPNCAATLERERLAMQAMMDGIYAYDRMHGGRHTVVGIQVENEPDMLLIPHEEDYPENFEYTTDEVCAELIKHLDELGQVVKDSKYKCYTRVNLTDRAYLSYLSEELPKMAGIDYVGLDPYNNKVNKISAQLDVLAALEGNFPHIAENGGEYENNDQLELLAFTKGAGYEVFEVVTTYSPELVDWELRGVFHTDFSKKPHTQRLIDANKIYRDGFLDLVLAGEGKVLGFNLMTSGGQDKVTQTLTADGISITHATTERGIAYAAVRGKVVTLASTKADTFTINADALYCEKGYYSMDGVWHKEKSVSVKGGKLKVEATGVYRVLVA